MEIHTSKYVLIFLVTFLNMVSKALSQNSTDGNNTICSLTGLERMDPFPSLIKCYKYNSDACCTSVHDDYINNFIGNFLTSSCARRYSELEDLFCYGCNPFEIYYSSPANKTIAMCLSFALRLWNGTVIDDLSIPTTRFDNCGFKVTPGVSPQGLVNAANGKPYVIPSEAFTDIYDFLRKVGIPLFDDYQVQIIDDTNIKDTSSVCFGCSQFIPSSLLMLSLVLLAILI